MTLWPEVKKYAIVTALLAPLFVPLMLFLWDRTPPYTFEKVEITPQEVPSGGEIYITFTIKPNRPTCGPGTVYREYREASGKLHLYDPITRAEPPTPVDGKFTRIAKLPVMSLGRATYRGHACYNCNLAHQWLRWPVCVTTPDVPFTVVEKKL